MAFAVVSKLKRDRNILCCKKHLASLSLALEQQGHRGMLFFPNQLKLFVAAGICGDQSQCATQDLDLCKYTIFVHK